MRQTNTGALVLGALIIAAGLLFLLGNVFRFDAGELCLPVGLILIGSFLLLRPRFVSAGVRSSQVLLGEIRRNGAWRVADEEYWMFVGDIDLDLTQADIPAGETRLRLFAFVADTDIIVPQHVGVTVVSTAFVSDLKLWNGKRESFLAPVTEVSENWATAERKVRIEATYFVADVTVRRV
jgi:predicted membrane protein